MMTSRWTQVAASDGGLHNHLMQQTLPVHMTARLESHGSKGPASATSSQRLSSHAGDTVPVLKGSAPVKRHSRSNSLSRVNRGAEAELLTPFVPPNGTVTHTTTGPKSTSTYTATRQVQSSGVVPGMALGFGSSAVAPAASILPASEPPLATVPVLEAQQQPPLRPMFKRPVAAAPTSTVVARNGHAPVQTRTMQAMPRPSWPPEEVARVVPEQQQQTRIQQDAQVAKSPAPPAPPSPPARAPAPSSPPPNEAAPASLPPPLPATLEPVRAEPPALDSPRGVRTPMSAAPSSPPPASVSAPAPAPVHESVAPAPTPPTPVEEASKQMAKAAPADVKVKQGVQIGMVDSVLMKGMMNKHSDRAEGFAAWRAARRVFRMVLRLLDHTHNRDAPTMARSMAVSVTHPVLAQRVMGAPGGG